MSDFRAARDFLLHADYDTARSDFRWPEPAEFNWALDWFDGVLAAETPARDRAQDPRQGRLHLRRAVRPLQPGGQLAARAGRPAR